MEQTSPYRMQSVRHAVVHVIGKIWMPMVTAAYDYSLSDYDLENIGQFTRANVERWLGTHAGDFQSIEDFQAECGRKTIPWKSEESEVTYIDLRFPSED